MRHGAAGDVRHACLDLGGERRRVVEANKASGLRVGDRVHDPEDLDSAALGEALDCHLSSVQQLLS